MQSNEQDRESLTAFLDNVCQTSHLRVEADLGDGFVRLRSDEAERRQAAHDIRSSEDIVIEMLRNSRDAEAQSIYVATTKTGSKRTIVVVDDGVGVPVTHQALIFEPRVTSKLDSVHMDKWGVHGRGMALYSIAVNAESASVALSGPGLGAAIAVQTDTEKLSEKADQSTFPVVAIAEKGRAVIRGPHNILRTAVEFALEHRKATTVYLGSPAEVAATMYANGCESVPATRRLFTSDLSTVPVANRLCYAKDDKELAALCGSMGLEMSTRTARRIMDGQVRPLEPLSDAVERMLLESAGAKTPEGSAESSAPDRAAAKRGRRAPRITPEDLEPLEEAVRRSFGDLAQAYYLSPDVPVEAKVVNGSLRISVPLLNLDE